MSSAEVDQRPQTGEHDDAPRSIGGASALDPVAGHRGRMRRARRWYIAGIVICLAVVAGVLGRVWDTAEVRHTTLHSALAPARQIRPTQPAPSVSLVWRSPDRAARGVPYWGGTVVTWNDHSVYGLDAVTGGIRWSYTRTDRRLCSVVQTQNRAVASYAHDGNCDELTALAVDTGQRAWTRTITDNGDPTVSVGLYTVLFTTPAQVHAVDPQSGIDRWVYTEPDGCRTRSAVLGTGGTLISQRCTDGDHLLLRDPYKGTDEKTGTVIWTQKSDLLPVSADTAVTAFDPASGHLQILDKTKGTAVRTLELGAQPTLTSADIDQAALTSAEIVWLGGKLYAIDITADQPLWSVSTSAMPSVTGPSPTSSPDTLADATLVVRSANGIDELNGATGAVVQHWSVPAPPPGSAVFPLGAGFVVADGQTVVYR